MLLIWCPPRSWLLPGPRSTLRTRAWSGVTRMEGIGIGDGPGLHRRPLRHLEGGDQVHQQGGRRHRQAVRLLGVPDRREDVEEELVVHLHHVEEADGLAQRFAAELVGRTEARLVA